MNKKKINCPSPENPCICLCHLEDKECWECRMGRHKPKQTKPKKKDKYKKIKEEFDKKYYPLIAGFPKTKDSNHSLVEDLWQFIVNSLDQREKEIIEKVSDLEVLEPPKDVEKLKEKRQAFLAGQMNILLRIKMLTKK